MTWLKRQAREVLHHQNEGSPSFDAFSSFREMIREERDASRGDRGATASKQRQLKKEVIELRRRLALEARQPERTVQSSSTTGDDSTTMFGSAPMGAALRIQYFARRYARDKRTGSHMTPTFSAHHRG